MAGWLAVVFRAAEFAPPLPHPRLRTVAGYRRVDPEAAVHALCTGRQASPGVIRTLGRLAGFVEIPRQILLRHIDLGRSAELVAYLLRQPWLPRSGLDSQALVQLCSMPSADAEHIRDLASRTRPDGLAFRALWGLAGGWSSRGRVARELAAEWAEQLEAEEVEASVQDTALRVVPPSVEEDLEPEVEAAELEALREALSMSWVQGLQPKGETVRNVYCNRLLTAEAVEVARLAARALEPGDVELLLADAEPCLMRHDSRGTAALLDWLGRGGPRPVFARLLHGLLRTCGARHPPEHTRASVEAVECLLSSCPRLAQSSLHLEQLGLSSDGSSCGLDSPGGSASGRLMPLQTLCLHCETANAHSVTLARALLRRAPEACSRPLPRVLRRNARGGGGVVFVGDATAVIRHRCLAAEESGKDSTHLRELLRVLQGQVDTNAMVGGSPGRPSGLALPEQPPAAIVPPPRPAATPPSARSARPRPRLSLSVGSARGGGSASVTLCQTLPPRARGLPPLGALEAAGDAGGSFAASALALSPRSAAERDIRGLPAWRCTAARCSIVTAALPAIGAR